MKGYAIQLKDSFRDKPVKTANGLKKHIMFVFAESEEEVLAVPMDSILTNNKQNKYPQKDEFPLIPKAYGYSKITTDSFINYKKAGLYSKLQLDILIKDYEIDKLEPISDEFLKDLKEKGKTSKFLKKELKKFLFENI